MSPVIINDATEEMYVFVEIHMSECSVSSLPDSGNSPLYIFGGNEDLGKVEWGKEADERWWVGHTEDREKNTPQEEKGRRNGTGSYRTDCEQERESCFLHKAWI